jgi:hypothetical protein
MTNTNDILKLANAYHNECIELLKEARIMKMKGKYRVVSEKGKNLGESDSKAGAEKRLRQVEYFKHRDQHSAEDKELDLTDVEEFSYSAIMRKLREKADKEQVRLFLTLYKKHFDNAVKDKLQKPEKVALQNAVVKFSKKFKIKFPKKMVKNAAISELGDAAAVGAYLANIVKFTLQRISPEKRPGSLENLKNKLYSLNETEIASKKMPASSAIGQSITFVKHVLFNHNSTYIREVLNNLVRNL